MVARRAVRRAGKVRVAKTSASTVRGQPALSVRVTIKQQFIRLWIKHLRADGHANNHIRALFARTIAALSVQTAAGDVQRVVTKVQQRIQRRVTDEPNVATAASVTARRSTARDKLFAPESSHAVAAVASLDPNLYAIDEHTEKVS